MKGDASLRLGDYEIHRAWEGFASIRQISSGEIMHSRTDPIVEARQLYVDQSHLAERLGAGFEEPLVIWDVGLGAAANVMAVMDCYEKASASPPLRIVSFDNDLDPLRLALANPQDFSYLRVDAANAIVTGGEWSHRSLRWSLFLADFLERMNQAPAPDVIFYDMFSTKTSARLWEARTFRQIFEACAGRPVDLFTYTCSTANRAALLSAGFFVARGRNAGAKVETTIALTPEAFRSAQKQNRDFLSPDWLAKWERSAAKFPADISPNERSAFEKIIREHEQFRNSAVSNRLPATT
jgi:queuine tRNA-ribosyltransferase